VKEGVVKASSLTVAVLVAGCGAHTGEPLSETSSAVARCEAVPLDIFVGEFEGLTVNAKASDLDGLRRAAREKAAACEGVTPTGTYEGPGYVTVISSMIWPILREELPDLELDSRYRPPGGRSFGQG
jgi:hypothetical protein